MQIIENFNDVSAYLLLKEFSKNNKKEPFGSLFDNFYTYDLIKACIEKKLGKLLIDENYNHLFIIDIFKFFQETTTDKLASFLKRRSDKDVNERYDEVIDFINKQVLPVVPNTFFFISNIKFNYWLDNNSLIKKVLDAYPCYNMITYTNEPISDNDIRNSNESRSYSFSSNVWDQNVFYYNYIDRAKRIKESNIIRIAKHPDLLEIFDDYRNKTIPMILPMNNPLEEKDEYKEYKGKGIKIILDGFKLDLLGSKSYFTSSIGSKIDALLYPNVDYNTFYDLENSFDLFKVFEAVRIYNINNVTYQALFFYSFKALKDNIYPNEKARIEKDFIPEDKMVSDIYSILPIHYENYQTIIKNISKENNFISNNLITGLKFQENFEFGNEDTNVNIYSKRVERYDLGSVKIYLTEEPHYNYYKKTKMLLINEEPVNIRLICSIDTETHSGILYLLHMGIKGKPTRYLDEVARNGLVMPYDEEDPYMHDIKIKYTDEGKPFVSLYNYINKRFTIKRCGEPRHLILSPYLSDEAKVINEYEENKITVDVEKIHKQYKEIKSSLLYGRSYLDEGEELGAIVDKELDEMYENDWGIAVYEYSTIYVSKCTVLQYADTYKDYLPERIDFAVVNLFYLEIIQLEVAAIKNATENISSFINGYKIKTSTKNKTKKGKEFKNDVVLAKLDEIQEEYAKTIDLWNIQTNYLSSKIVLQKLKDKFDIEKDIDYLQRIRDEIQSIYQSRQNKISNKTGKLVGIFGVLLALPDLVSIYVDAAAKAAEDGIKYPLFFDKEIEIINKISGVNILRVALLILLLYFCIRLIAENKKGK